MENVYFQNNYLYDKTILVENSCVVKHGIQEKTKQEWLKWNS